MAVIQSRETPGLWFALTRANKIEKIFYSLEKAKEYIREKRNKYTT